MSRDRADIRHDRRGIRPTAATFARTGVTSGKTAATETKLTRVGRRRQGNLPPFFVEQRRPIALDLPKPAKRKLSQGEGR